MIEDKHDVGNNQMITKFEIFIDIVEHIASSGENFHVVMGPIKANEHMYQMARAMEMKLKRPSIGHINVPYQIVSNNPFHWKNIATGIEGTTRVGFYCDCHALHLHEGVIRLGSVLGLRIDEIFPDRIAGSKGTQIQVNKQFCYNSYDYANDLPLPSDGVVNGRRYKLIHILPVNLVNGQTAGCIWIYKVEGAFIAIPGYLAEQDRDRYTRIPQVEVGMGQAHCRLYNELELRMNPNAVILLHVDICQAANSQALIKDSASLERGKYIVSSWFGSMELSSYIKFDGLAGRHVVIVPTADNAHIAKVLNNMKMLQDLWKSFPPASVRISMPIYAEDGTILEASPLSRLKDPLGIPRFVESASSEAEVNSLVEKYIDEPATAVVGEEEDLPIWTLADNFAKPMEQIPVASVNLLVKPSIDTDMSNLIRPGNLTIVAGGSDVGKGRFLLSLLLALAGGASVFGMPVEHAKRVLLIDGETEIEQFRKKILRTAIALGIDCQDVQHFYALFMRSNKVPMDFNLLNPQYRELVEGQIKKLRPEVVAFDNLATLFTGKSMDSAWREIRTWFLALEKNYHTSVVFCHHTNSDDQLGGSYWIKSLSQSILQLIQVKDGGSPLLTKAERALLEKYDNPKDTLFKLKVVKLKEEDFYGTLEDAGYLLSSDVHAYPSWQKINLADGSCRDVLPLIPQPSSEEKQDIQSPATQQPADMSRGVQVVRLETDEVDAEHKARVLDNIKQPYPGLTDDYYKVINYVAINGKITRRQVEEITGWKRAKAGEILKDLCDRSILKKEGSANIFYTLLNS